jgi:hypothetical protein
MIAEIEKQQAVTGETFFLGAGIKCSRAQEFEKKLATRIVSQER